MRLLCGRFLVQLNIQYSYAPVLIVTANTTSGLHNRDTSIQYHLRHILNQGSVYKQLPRWENLRQPLVSQSNCLTKHRCVTPLSKRNYLNIAYRCQGHVVTLELSSGQVYRGKLLEAEDNMNVQLKDVQQTARDGRVSHLDQIYIRGSHVRFFIVPDMLRNAPMFRSRGTRGRGVGLARGRATVNRARAGRRG